MKQDDGKVPQFTLFHLLMLLGMGVGAAFGFVGGTRTFGTVGGVVGVPVGVILGAVVGWLPFAATWWSLRWQLKRSSTGKLKERFRNQYFLSAFIIAELLERGEPVENLRDDVAEQLNSTCSRKRRFGQQNALLLFPDLVDEQ